MDHVAYDENPLDQWLVDDRKEVAKELFMNKRRKSSEGSGYLAAERTFKYDGWDYPADSKYAKLMSRQMLSPLAHGDQDKWDAFRDWAVRNNPSDKELKGLMNDSVDMGFRVKKVSDVERFADARKLIMEWAEGALPRSRRRRAITSLLFHVASGAKIRSVSDVKELAERNRIARELVKIAKHLVAGQAISDS